MITETQAQRWAFTCRILDNWLLALWRRGLAELERRKANKP